MTHKTVSLKAVPTDVLDACRALTDALEDHFVDCLPEGDDHEAAEDAMHDCALNALQLALAERLADGAGTEAALELDLEVVIKDLRTNARSYFGRRSS